MRRDWRDAITLGAIVLATYVLFHLLPQGTRHHLTEENNVTELLGTGALGATSVLLFVAWRRARRTGAGGRIPQLFLLGMAFMFFLGFGEELSWGQQFFHWGTPSEFA